MRKYFLDKQLLHPIFDELRYSTPNTTRSTSHSPSHLQNRELKSDEVDREISLFLTEMEEDVELEEEAKLCSSGSFVLLASRTKEKLDKLWKIPVRYHKTGGASAS